jgi:hypothetical protein
MAEDPQTAAIVRKIVRHLMPVLGGLVTLALAFTHNAPMFYTLRFLRALWQAAPLSRESP